MPPSDPQLPAPPAVVRSFHGIESLRDAVKGGDLDHVQLGRGVMTGTVGSAPLGGCVLGFGQTEMPVRTRGVFNPAGYALGVLLDVPGPARTWGAESGPGSVLVCPPRTEADINVFGPHRYAYLIVPPGVWEGAVAAVRPDAAAALLGRRGLYRPPPAVAGALGGRLAELVRLGSGGAGLPAGAGAAARDELFVLFARAAAAGAEAAPPCGRFFRHARVVARAEEYLRGRLGRDVYLAELCGHCDVSERTLHYAFREVLGLTPMAYLRRRRLAAIRAELAAADPAPGVIARAALRWGFWHLGEFSAAYKAMFGEPPGAVLRRPPG